MFQVLLLICAVTLPHHECQLNTALDVIQGPPAANEVQCGLYGQAYLAETAVKPHANEYLKVRCVHTNIGSENVG